MRNRVFAGLGFLGMTFIAFGKDVARMTPQEAQKLIMSGKAVVVDVRENDEVKHGMVTGAKVMPMSTHFSSDTAVAKVANELPKDKTIILYCARGGRAQQAAMELSAQGFKTANMGGFSDWANAGFPTQKP